MRRIWSVLVSITVTAATVLPLGVAAHAEGGELLPAWVQSIFGYYADGLISDAELIGAIEYLVGVGIISLPDDGGDDSKIEDNGDFYFEYGPNPNSSYETSAADWMQSVELLEREIDWLNENFRLPYDVGVFAAECGEVNAYYYPYPTAEVKICYEYVDNLFDQYYENVDSDADKAARFAYDVTVATFYHEMGHAFIDVYDLPITGMEENVVDQFEALVLSYTYDDDAGYYAGQDMMYNVGNHWLYSSADSGESLYWDTHGTDMQRFYNISCYAYGADPEYNQDLIEDGWLPEPRAKWCVDEYEQMKRGWAHLLQDYTNGFLDSVP